MGDIKEVYAREAKISETKFAISIIAGFTSGAQASSTSTLAKGGLARSQTIHTGQFLKGCRSKVMATT